MEEARMLPELEKILEEERLEKEKAEALHTKPEETSVEAKCYTIEDLMAMLGVSRKSVNTLLERHVFRWFKIGAIYRISRKSFDEWMDSMA